jgi:heme iron utilization protein
MAAPAPRPNGGGPVVSAVSEDPPVWQSRKLLRAARSATLATSTEGQPFASLITPACAPDLGVLLLLSDLSEHTRHLRDEPRCAVLVTGEPTTSNPQTTPRLTVTGLAGRLEDPALKARWLALHPYAALYADFGDFSLWQLRIGGGLLVAGFGRASRLRPAKLLPAPASVASVAAAEDAILAEWNGGESDTLAAIAAGHGGGDGSGPWRMVAVDVDGCDLAQGERVLRVPWSAPAADADGVRRELITLAKKATAS